MVAESTSPVGKGTAGLLLMKGMLPLFSGITGNIAGAGEIPPSAVMGSGVGAPDPAFSRGWNGHGNAGEDETTPPDVAGREASGGVDEFSDGCGGAEGGII